MTRSGATAYDAAGGRTTISASRSANTGQSPLVARLHPQYEVARQLSFALFVRVYLEQKGLLRASLVKRDESAYALEAVGAALEDVAQANPHLLAALHAQGASASLENASVDAIGELIGWCAAQRADREEPLIAYELGMLALGVELPGILVGALRQIDVQANTSVIELPDGSGYPTVFLASLHPDWRGAARAHLLVSSDDAEQLAASALVTLTGRLSPVAGQIERISEPPRQPLHDSPFDVALVYNPVPWLGPDGGALLRNGIHAREVVVL